MNYAKAKFCHYFIFFLLGLVCLFFLGGGGRTCMNYVKFCHHCFPLTFC